MAEHSHIEWTDATWNPITGCSVISPGCTNCYAMRLAGTRLAHVASRAGLTRDSKAGPVWTGEVRFNEAALLDPLRWRRPRMIFVCAHGDLFHEAVPDAWIDRVFAVMAMAPGHTFQLLTKRSARMRRYLTAMGTPTRAALAAPGIPQGGRATMIFNATWPLPNVWIGVSAEDQARADERIPDLLGSPAALRWISAEPLLGPLDLTADGLVCNECERCSDGSLIEWDTGANACRRCDGTGKGTEWGIDWIVAGGESGPGARPMHPDWARSLRDQCAAAGVAFHFKQFGAWAPAGEGPSEFLVADGVVAHHADHDIAFAGHMKAGGPFVPATRLERVGKALAGRLLDGRTHDGFPGMPI